jgi:hypothetical protein
MVNIIVISDIPVGLKYDYKRDAMKLLSMETITRDQTCQISPLKYHISACFTLVS